MISFFNPEMVREWRVLHEAKLHLGLDPDTGKPRWSLVVPRDDGTIAALVTALRLSGGNEEAPLESSERIAVQRLGGPGAAVAARSQRGLVLAGSRTDLERAVVSNTAATLTGSKAASKAETGRTACQHTRFGADLSRFIAADSPVPAQGNLGLRRVIEAADGLGLRAARGMMGLQNDQLTIELSAELDPANPSGAIRRENRLGLIRTGCAGCRFGTPWRL